MPTYTDTKSLFVKWFYSEPHQREEIAEQYNNLIGEGFTPFYCPINLDQQIRGIKLPVVYLSRSYTFMVHMPGELEPQLITSAAVLTEDL